MARPPLPVGTYGAIRAYSLPSGRGFRATANFRDFDGVTRRIERSARTETAAKNALREALRDRVKGDGAGELTADTRVRELAELWFLDIRAAVDAGEKSPGTEELYRSALDLRVIPGLGELRLREVTVGRVGKLLVSVRENHGPMAAKRTRTVLNGMMTLAARHDAIRSNPVRDSGRITGVTTQKPATALELDQVHELRSKLAADERAVGWDLPDFVDFMLATGLRIGEATATTWDALDLDAGTVEVRGTVIRVKGKGLVLKLKPKTKAGCRTLRLPAWVVDMLRRRQAGAPTNEWNAVFTAPLGGLRDPSNTQADLRSVLDDAGYPWVTSHTFRKTAATLLERSGMTARAVADQLGHSDVTTTQNHYFGRKMVSDDAATVLEAIDTSPVEQPASA